MKIAELAADMVRNDTVIGLGTGRTATEFLRELARRIRDGLRVKGVPTSRHTSRLARKLGIPLATLDEAGELDAAFDGADAVDPRLDLIKGFGGALLREKVVASSSRRLIILVGEHKLTQVFGLGYCKKLPIEVVPFSIPLVARRLARHGLEFRRRLDDETSLPFVTDNRNAILDIEISGTIPDPHALEQALRAIPGIVETGLFLGMAHLVLVQRPDGSHSSFPRVDHDAIAP